ncbi:hypothetical protein RJT34_25062 [Clitoria ternatea]|uniref:RRM domain-containing protein n=1 Tax=Clitoria ternatea TaxID=43366 RepID=A0AAN9IJQ5_CLITE
MFKPFLSVRVCVHRMDFGISSSFSSLVWKMRPIFCGNFEYDARQSELERLFRRYGKVDRVDMKSGLSWHIHLLPS